MVKLTSPMHSQAASGTIAKQVTFSNWKGRAYARARVIPANPCTGPQVGIRAMMTFLTQAWKSIAANTQATWDALAKSGNFSAFNAFIQANQTRWGEGKGPSQATPATATSTIAGAATTTPTAGVLNVSLSIAAAAQAPSWAWIIYRSKITGFTPSYANAVWVVPYTGTTQVVLDAPLEAVEYFYRIGGLNTDGKLGTLEAEINSTPTARPTV